MNKSSRFWFALHPDLPKPIGGVKQIHRFAEALIECGFEVALIQEDANFHPGWFSSSVPAISLDEWSHIRTKLSPSKDIVVLPETYLPLFATYAPGLPKIIFNQNASYTFGPPDIPPPLKHSDVISLYRHPELLHVCCVSQHDEEFLSRGLGIDNSSLTRLINPIEVDLFHPQGPKKFQIAYMPRKNVAHVASVLAVLRQQPWFSRWTLAPIHKLSQADVSSILQESLIFLAFGHPEGFGLPLAEALACGCSLVGYSGLGGRELFALANDMEVGFEVPFGDWLGFVNSCSSLDTSFREHPDRYLSSLLTVSKTIRTKYSQAAFLDSVREFLRKIN